MAGAVASAASHRTSETDYSVPHAGASWIGKTDTGNNAGFIIELDNASLTIEGFSHLECPDGSMIVVGNSSSLDVRDCHFRGITQADTAAIDTGPMGQSISTSTPNSNVTISVADSSFENNARGILTRSTQGTTRLDITNTHFAGNSAWPIEYRVGAGDHVMNITDSIVEWSNNSPVRLYAFHNQNAALATNYAVNIDRTRFNLSGAARAALVMGGVENVSHPSSSWHVEVTNSIFDLRHAAAFADTSALNALPETFRRGTARFRHATIVTGDANHSGFVWRGGTANVLTVLNSIIDGSGTALNNTGSGSIISGVNLLNSTNAVGGGGTTTLSGNELVAVSPQFVDRAAGDFRLELDSPAVGVGDDLDVETDFAGNPRPNPVGALPDLGAFEMAPPASLGDINVDGVVNVADVTKLAALISDDTPPPIEIGDINGDGSVDEQDVHALAELIVNQP